MGAELFHEDGRAERRGEADSRFSKFCESVQQLKETSGTDTSRRNITQNVRGRNFALAVWVGTLMVRGWQAVFIAGRSCR